MSVITIGVALLFLSIAFTTYHRYRRRSTSGIPLSRLEKIGWIVTIVAGIVAILIAAAVYLPPLSNYLKLQEIQPIWIWVGLIVFIASIIATTTFRYKKRIERSLAKHSYENLERKIRKELETEAIAKNLTFPHQLKDDIISKLANRVSSDIMNISTPTDYSVQQMNDRVGDVDVYLGEHILAIPFSEAKILADKMTELSKNPSYRKKNRWLHLFWV